jgi:catechol 2,3-dioxygenase-like lactoylglutathione lyase family enzyme
MLGDQQIIAFIGTAAPAASLAFYRDVIGLRLVEDSPFALVFEGGGRMLRIQKLREIAPAPYTALGWQVADIAAEMTALVSKGVTFRRYPHMDQDETGVWTTPDGARVVWFSDPDGNNLSLTQFP